MQSFMLSDLPEKVTCAEQLLLHALVTQPDKSDIADCVCIGSGSYSLVFSARQISTGSHVAIKVAKGENSACLDASVLRELRAMHCIRHPNVLKLQRIFMIAGALAFQTKLYNVTLSGMWPACAAHAPGIMRKVAQALNAAHSLGYLHRDVKPENIFLGETTEDVVLGDWGLSRYLGDCSPDWMTGNVITTFYAPPEVLCHSEAYGTAADVWSLGMTLLEMCLTDDWPFTADMRRSTFMTPMLNFLGTEHVSLEDMHWLHCAVSKSSSQRSALVPKKRPGTLWTGGNLPDGAFDLLRGMLHYVPSKRWTLDQVMAHPFLNTHIMHLQTNKSGFSGILTKQVEGGELAGLHVFEHDPDRFLSSFEPGWNPSLWREAVVLTFKFAATFFEKNALTSYLCAMHISKYVPECTMRLAIACLTLSYAMCTNVWTHADGIRSDSYALLKSKSEYALVPFGIANAMHLAEFEKQVLMDVKGILPDIPWKQLVSQCPSTFGMYQKVSMYAMATPRLVGDLNLAEDDIVELAKEAEAAEGLVLFEHSTRLQTVISAMNDEGIWCVLEERGTLATSSTTPKMS